MGVLGLTTFIDKNTHLLHKHELRNCSVVIDGNNLYHHIYRGCHIEAKFGGDYDVYRQQLRINFKSLLKCGVTPYVVLDGGYTTDNKKLKKCVERARQRISNAHIAQKTGKCQLLPLLAYDTFIQTLEELNIPHATCQYEADGEIAKLANRLKCPVISNDSDFYIFDLTHGFLPLDYLDFNLLHKKNADGSKSAPFLHCQYYNIDGFLESFEGLHRSMLPVFATLLGNDYAPPLAFLKINQSIQLPKKKRVHLTSKISKVLKLIHWLTSCYNDSDNFIDSIMPYIRARKKFISSVEGYFDIDNFEGFDLFKYFTKGKEPFMPVAAASFSGYNGSSFPTWFLSSVCQGQITPTLINAAVLHRVLFLTQVEDLTSPTIYLCSEHIRRAIYGILMTSDPVSSGGKNAKVLVNDLDVSNGALSEALQSVMEKIGNSADLAEITTQKGDDPNEEMNEEVENDLLCGMDKCNINEKVDNDSAECEASVMTKMENDSDGELDEIEDVSDSEDSHIIPAKKKQTKFEEYHRECRHLKKMYLDPLICESLPTLTEIGDLNKEKRLSLLLRLLEIDHSFIRAFSEDLSLYMVSIVTWILHANPQFTEHHLDCAILCPILLHILNPISSIDGKNPRKNKTSSKSGCEKNKGSDKELEAQNDIDLDKMCDEVKVANKSKFYTVRDNLNKYRTIIPVFNPRKGYLLDCKTIHAFGQLQTCMYEISNLNKLLRFPLPNIQPAFFVNGSFLYNFYTDLVSRPVPSNFLEGILLKGSGMHELFLSIKSTVLKTVGTVSYFSTPTSDKIKKRKKKNKGKKKKCPCDEEEEEIRTKSGEESDEEVTTLEGFDIQNKYSLLLC